MYRNKYKHTSNTMRIQDLPTTNSFES